MYTKDWSTSSTRVVRKIGVSRVLEVYDGVPRVLEVHGCFLNLVY